MLITSQNFVVIVLQRKANFITIQSTAEKRRLPSIKKKLLEENFYLSEDLNNGT